MAQNQWQEGGSIKQHEDVASGMMDTNAFIFLNVVVVLQLYNYVWYVMSVISENISSCML